MRWLNWVMLLIVPLVEIQDRVTMLAQSRFRSRPFSCASPNSTPEAICNSARIGVLPYSLSLKSRNVHIGRIVDRFDGAVRDGQAHQQTRDGFHHRLGNQPVVVGAVILIALAKDLVVLRNQQSGDRIAREIVFDRRCIAAKAVADFGRRALEVPGRWRMGDTPRHEDIIDMTERADTIFRWVRIALPPSPLSRDGISLRRTIMFSVRSCRRKDGARIGRFG